MNKKDIHQNLLRRAVPLAVVMISMFTMPTGAWAQQVLPELYALWLVEGWDAHGATVSASYLMGDETQVYTSEQFGEEPATLVPEGTTVTLTIMPGEGYVVDEVSVAKYVEQPEEGFVIGGGSRTRGTADAPVVVSHTDDTNVWSFTMPAYNAEATVTYKAKPVQKKAIEASWITLTDATDLVYDGTAKTPGVVVNDGETTLSAETDYEVTYSNNKNACKATAENAPTVTVTARETSTNYTSSATATFTIGTATVTASGFTVKDKEKDGDDQMAELITAGVKLDGVITGSGDNQGDQVGIKGVTGIFEDADVGEDKIVNLDYTNASLTGNDAANYTLDKANSQPTATGRLYILTETSVDGDGNVIETTKIKVKDADGFVFGTLETTKTTKKASDGSVTGTISETAKKNDGAVNQSSDGVIEVVVADGKTTETTNKTDKDAAGNVIQTTQTVKTTKKAADGKTTETVNTTLIDRNGVVIRVTETVKETVKDSDGKTIETIKEKVSETYHNPIRTIVTDKKIVKTPDGQKTETINATATEVNDKTITTTASVIETKADGSQQETKTVTHADNSVTVTVKETVKNADGSKSITIMNTEKDAGGEITETKEILKKIEMGTTKTETIQETIMTADGTTTTSYETKITEWDGYDPTLHPISEKAQKTVKDADKSEIGSSQTVKRLYLDAHFNVYYSLETIEEKWKYPDGSSTETKEEIEANANGTVIKYSKQQIKKDANGTTTTISEVSLENGSLVDISRVSNTQLDTPEGRAGRVSLVSIGTGESMRQSINVSQGSAVQMALPYAQKGGGFQMKFEGEVSKGMVKAKSENLLRVYLSPRTASRTRGAEDEMIEIVSGEEYLVLQDGPLVLTFDVEEGPISIESITLTDPDPNDLDGSGKVDAVDLVRAIGEGKTQDGIDEIVNAIMQK